MRNSRKAMLKLRLEWYRWINIVKKIRTECVHEGHVEGLWDAVKLLCAGFLLFQWDFVWDHQSQKSVVQSLVMAGMLVGGPSIWPSLRQASVSTSLLPFLWGGLPWFPGSYGWKCRIQLIVMNDILLPQSSVYWTQKYHLHKIWGLFQNSI